MADHAAQGGDPQKEVHVLRDLRTGELHRLIWKKWPAPGGPRQWQENPFWVDEQTGRAFPVRKEETRDHIWALVSIGYLALAMAFFFWVMFDFWAGAYRLAGFLRYSTDRLSDPTFRVFAAAFIGGALGGIVDGLRSAIDWHGSNEFGRRYTCKHILAPFRGAALALIVVTLLRSGISVLTGADVPKAGDLRQWLTSFGVGALAGYGSFSVAAWLDAQVSRLFKVQARTPIVPLVVGRTKRDAEFILAAARLKRGKVRPEGPSGTNTCETNIVIGQDPAAGWPHKVGGAVSITVASRSEGHRSDGKKT